MKKQTITVAEFLMEKGIKTNKDLYAFLKRNVKPGRSESNYDIMVRVWGENIAMKVMRLLEVAEWSFDPMFNGGKRRKAA